jgi:hypothetical protein
MGPLIDFISPFGKVFETLTLSIGCLDRDETARASIEKYRSEGV